MRSEWRSGRLGDFIELKRGYDLPQAKRVSGPIPLVSSSGVSDYHAEAMVKGPGVITGRYGTIGQVYFVEDDFWPLNTALYVRDFKGNDPKFICYFLKTVDFHAYSDKAAVPGINRNHLHEASATIPALPVQRAIAEFLGSIDDRITLLRETNATLEAIARALFKSWFVDFDPVRAKQEGRAPEGMDEATAALFPDSFEESALGLVPRGWRVGMLGELARIHKGTTNPLSQPDVVFEHYSLPAFDSGQMPVLDRGSEIKSNKSPVPNKAVLRSKLNPHIPRVWLPSDSGKNAVCSTEFLVFTPTNGASREFVFCQFSTAQFQQALCQLVTGTSNSHQRVKADGVLAMSAVIPLPGAQVAFGDIIRPIFDRIGHNRQQAQTLATLRDTLLPRLISGRLRLPEAEGAVAAAL